MTMNIIHTISELREALDTERAAGATVGLVPTMGALHGGHEQLMAEAVAATDVVAATIYVNPLQFAPNEDLDSYPRMLDADAAAAERAGVKYLFVPSDREMYPEENWTTVSLRVVTEPWEGESRPTHFAGVATVVAKYFNIAGPCVGFFGEKDFQQLAMLKRMVSDLNMAVEVVGVATVREDDGLAMSSRNLRLTAEHREQAPVVQRALQAGAASIEAGERDPAVVERAIRDVIATAPGAASPDYVAVVDASSLVTPTALAGDIRLLTAVYFGDVRLIDNIGVTVS